MSSSIMPTGFGHLEDAVKRQAQGFSPPTGKLSYFSLANQGDKMFVRFIDDAIVTVKFYEWIINNQGETSEFISAPDLYRNDPNWVGEDWLQKYKSATPGIGWAKEFNSDKVSEPKAKEKAVGIAVEQEQVLDDDGKPVAGKFRDKLVKIEDKDGKKHTGLRFLLCRQALSNFWDQFVGYYSLNGNTIMDRPYLIERRGVKPKIQYNAIHMAPYDDWDPADPDGSRARLQAYYGYGIEVTEEGPNPEGYTWENRYLYCGTTVAAWCEKRASEDWAKFWLDPNAEHLQKKAGQGGVSAEDLLNTARPADPRAPLAPPTTPPAAATPPVAAAEAAPANGADEFHESTTHNPAAVPAAPATGDRFEKVRQEMADRHAAAANK